MTCRERLKLEHPESVVNECDPPYDASYLDYAGGCMGCPLDYGYLEAPDWCSLFDCERCWDREIPDNSLEHEPFRPLGESVASGFQSTKDHVYRVVDASCREDPSILFAKIADLLYHHYHGNVILRYKPKDGTIEAVPMIIDEELDK